MVINIDFIISIFFFFYVISATAIIIVKKERNVIINKKNSMKVFFLFSIRPKTKKKKKKKKGIRTRRLLRVPTSTLIPFYITFAQRNTSAKLQPSSAFSKLHLDRVLPANDKLSLTTTEFYGISSSSIDETVGVQKVEIFYEFVERRNWIRLTNNEEEGNESAS